MRQIDSWGTVLSYALRSKKITKVHAVTSYRIHLGCSSVAAWPSIE